MKEISDSLFLQKKLKGETQMEDFKDMTMKEKLDNFSELEIDEKGDVFETLFGDDDEDFDYRLLTHDEWVKSFDRKYVLLTQKLYTHFENNTEILKEDYYGILCETDEDYIDECLVKRGNTNG